MNFINLLGADADISGVVNEAYKTFKNVVDIVLPVFIAVVLVFGIVYGVILGINFAKAEDTDARDKAKGRLINLIIGVLVAVVIGAIIYAILSGGYIKKLFTKVPDNALKDPTSSSSSFLFNM